MCITIYCYLELVRESSAGHQPSRHRARDRLQRLEPQLLGGYAKLHQFRLVHPNGIIIRLDSMVYAVIKVLDEVVLRLDRVPDSLADLVDGLRVHVGVLDYLVELAFLLLELLKAGVKALLQQVVVGVGVALYL